jgi:DnaJ-class molecular chaperone
MYDFAVVNTHVGPCQKCSGTGAYSWGGTHNGKPANQGTCYSCRGTGHQTQTQRKRNECYNQHKVVHI